ncbi:unnamed protein product [Lupinus luteus]|uniref:Uncharacterized protein n=1 Tax=Lupinus luteus TaxID=3873 RepID=A0AAV1XKH5_LUPLU
MEFSISSNLIENLDLSETVVQILHSSIKNLTRLHTLNLENLRLRNLPNELSYLRSLIDLKISNCALVPDKQNLHDIFQDIEHLKILYLKDCPKMTELPKNICGLSDLYEERESQDISHIEQQAHRSLLLFHLDLLDN